MAALFFIPSAVRTSIQIAFNDVTAHVAKIIGSTNTTHVEAVLSWVVVHDALKDKEAWWAELHELIREAYRQEGTFTFTGGKLLMRLDPKGHTELVVDGFLMPQKL